MANPQAHQSVTLDAFLGLITNLAPESAPMGASPLNWDVDYRIGEVFTRAGLLSVYTFDPALTANLNYIKSFNLSDGGQYTLALDANGTL